MIELNQEKPKEYFHHYDDSGRYMGSTEAEYDPIERKPLLPRNATMQPPPQRTSGHWAFFNGGVWTLRELPEDEIPSIPLSVMFEDEALQSMYKEIDANADRLRGYALGDPLKAMEYAQAAQAAQAYLADPESGVPDEVQVWAESKGCTPEEAASDILNESKKTTARVAAIRVARLAAKARVRDADPSVRREVYAEVFNDMQYAYYGRPQTPGTPLPHGYVKGEGFKGDDYPKDHKKA